MKTNLNEAKAKLGRLVAQAQKGEVIVICSRNRPVAELRGIDTSTPQPPRLGVLRDKFSVPDDFDAPLEGLERDFYGQ